MKLVTHNERFHYDEILATAILLMIYPSSQIIRTRDKKEIGTGDIVYDVGGVYDPSTNRYDHHQHSFSETFSKKYKYKLSSSGLIYKHFHEKFFNCFGIDSKDALYNDFVVKIYEDFFLGADCIDNGVDIYGDIKPRTIYEMVDLFNNYENLTSEKQYKQFLVALDFVSKDLEMYIRNQIDSWWNKFKKLEVLIEKVDDSIFVSDEYYTCDLILDVEKKCGKDIKFLIYPSEGKYKIRAINISKGKYEIKMPLRQDWRGKSSEELAKICPGGIFVHKSGFIGINETLEGAINMCKETIKSH
ncbi:MYG1 exonuclease [Vairimorpha necatrix]|uniref:MYG1 exonuclease n=1 Tax=Vairimorpha necatrix TaxID=6039 RepID=A0AAX4JA39_9MICR